MKTAVVFRSGSEQAGALEALKNWIQLAEERDHINEATNGGHGPRCSWDRLISESLSLADGSPLASRLVVVECLT